MRCDQQMGLPPEAVAFLEENEKKPLVCDCCGRPFPKALVPIGAYVGMFETEYSLYRHELKNEGFADEFLQAAPWSSGPCFFLGLKITGTDGGVMVFEWTDSEIANP